MFMRAVTRVKHLKSLWDGCERRRKKSSTYFTVLAANITMKNAIFKV